MAFIQVQHRSRTTSQRLCRRMQWESERKHICVPEIRRKDSSKIDICRTDHHITCELIRPFSWRPGRIWGSCMPKRGLGTGSDRFLTVYRDSCVQFGWNWEQVESRGKCQRRAKRGLAVPFRRERRSAHSASLQASRRLPIPPGLHSSRPARPAYCT
jgi:hypothetical protein